MKAILINKWWLVLLLLVPLQASAETRNFSIDLERSKIEPALTPYMQDQWVKNTRFQKVYAKGFRVENFSNEGVQISCRVRIELYENAFVGMLKWFDTSVRVQLVLKPYMDLDAGYVGVKVDRTWISDATDIGNISFVKNEIQDRIRNALDGKDVFSRTIPSQVNDAIRVLSQNKIYVNGLALTTSSSGLNLKGIINYPGQLNIPDSAKIYFDGVNVSSDVQGKIAEYDSYNILFENQTSNKLYFKVIAGGGTASAEISLEPGKSTKRFIKSEKGKKPRITFDSSYAEGVQTKSYNIGNFNKEFFRESGGGIDLYH